MTQVADRVQETSTTTGTGTLTLAGAVTGWQSFATAFPAASTAVIPYCITDSSGNWETGYGTYTLSGTTLTRAVKQSSNANALVNFAAGTKSVFVTPIADLINTDGFSYGSTAPVNPQPGQRWIDPTVGVLYTYVNDGTSSQWVQF